MVNPDGPRGGLHDRLEGLQMAQKMSDRGRSAVEALLSWEPREIAAAHGLHEVAKVRAVGADMLGQGGEGLPLLAEVVDVRHRLDTFERAEIVGWVGLGSVAEIRQGLRELLSTGDLEAAGAGVLGRLGIVERGACEGAAYLVPGIAEHLATNDPWRGLHVVGGQGFVRAEAVLLPRARSWAAVSQRQMASVRQYSHAPGVSIQIQGRYGDGFGGSDRGKAHLEAELLRIIQEHAPEVQEAPGAEYRAARAVEMGAHDAAYRAGRELQGAADRARKALGDSWRAGVEEAREHLPSGAEILRAAVRELLGDAEIRAAVLAVLGTNELWDVLNERGEG